MKKTNVGKLVMIMTMTCSASALAEGITFTEETAAAFLKLTPPVTVLAYSTYLDGGSIGISLADAKTNELHIFEDHSLANRFAGKTDLPEHMREHYKDRANTAGRIFICEKSPAEKGKITPAEEGERIKAAVDCLATAWFDREVSPEDKTLLTEFFEQRHRGGKPNISALMKQMTPPQKRVEPGDDEGYRAAFDVYMRGVQRASAVFYIAGKLKGWNPPKDKM